MQLQHESVGPKHIYMLSTKSRVSLILQIQAYVFSLTQSLTPKSAFLKWFLRTWSTNGRPEVVTSLVCHRVGGCLHTSLKHDFVWGEVLPRSMGDSVPR